MSQELSQLQPLDVPNLREHAARQLRNAVLSGSFAPGQSLVETAIADHLGISRAPVREALAELEQEGIVNHIPRRGYFVVDFTDKDIEEIYSLRLLLEIAALLRAVERLTEQDVEELQRIVDNLGEAVRQGVSPKRIVALDLSFHESILHVADHSRLYTAWYSMRMQTQLLIGLTSRTHYNHPEQPKELHQRIVDAIRGKDAKQAEAILTEHILDGQERAHAALQALRLSKLEHPL